MSDQGYIPPHSIEAEQAVLGSIFVDPKCFPLVAFILPGPLAFWRASHQHIYRALLKIHEAGGELDWVTTTEQVIRDGRIEDCGGKDALHTYLSDMSHSVPSSYAAERYAGIVKDRYIRRELVLRAGDIRSMALDDTRAAHEAVQRLATDADKLTAEVECERGENVKPALVCLADVEAEPIQWLWQGRFALGKLSLLVGDPGLGKSTVTLDMAARVSRGLPWPDNTGDAPLGDVVMISAEDDAADTIRPRLDAAGGDSRRVFNLTGKYVRRGGVNKEAGITLEDLPVIETALKSRPECKLLVIDPIAAFMGKSDTHRDSEVRGLLAPLGKLASQRGIAVVIVAHMNKSSGQKALHRVGGSVGFTGAVRAGFVVAAHPADEDRRIMASIKNNLAPAAAALSFRLRSRGGDHAAVEWIEGSERFNVEQLVSAGGAEGDTSALDEAKEFLLAELGDGALKASEINSRRARANIGSRTLSEAKAVLKVKSIRRQTAEGASWWWALPGKEEPCNLGQGTTPLQPCNLTETPSVERPHERLLSKIARLQGSQREGNLAVDLAGADLADAPVGNDGGRVGKTREKHPRPILSLVEIRPPKNGNGHSDGNGHSED